MVLKRIGVGSAAKVTGAVYAALGLIFGAIFACIAMVGIGAASALSAGNEASPFLGAFFGVGAIVILPIMYGVIGVIGGAIGAWVYNLVAGMTGGLEIDLQ